MRGEKSLVIRLTFSEVESSEAALGKERLESEPLEYSAHRKLHILRVVPKIGVYKHVLFDRTIKVGDRSLTIEQDVRPQPVLCGKRFRLMDKLLGLGKPGVQDALLIAELRHHARE